MKIFEKNTLNKSEINTVTLLVINAKTLMLKII